MCTRDRALLETADAADGVDANSDYDDVARAVYALDILGGVDDDGVINQPYELTGDLTGPEIERAFREAYGAGARA